jgi:multiple sugar transport system substrate-binding protein
MLIALASLGLSMSPQAAAQDSTDVSQVAAAQPDADAAPIRGRLKLVWHANDAFLRIAEISKEYTRLTGIEVEMVQLPYGPEWHDRIAAEFAAHGDGFDLAVWDSQSVAEFAEGGHIEMLNDYVEKSPILSFDDFAPGSLKRYGEYPDGSGKIWAIPLNQDTVGLMYRTDLFEDPAEQAAFKEKYGYELRVPETYRELEDAAAFFTRPEDGLYGWAQFASIAYDFATSSSNGFIWSYGGELWNHQTNEILGYLNSPASVDGLEQYVKMFDYMPPEGKLWGYLEITDHFRQGELAMATQWYIFFDTFANPAKSAYAAQTGFDHLPGAVGRDGKFRRQFSLGGQGIGINSYSKKKEEAWAFIEWFMQREQQWQYSAVGQTARKDIINDPQWQELNGYNRNFATAIDHVNDYWHLPQYISLLEILQQEIVNAVHGKKTAHEALTDAARRQEAVLTNAGYRIERSPSIPDVPDTILNPVGTYEQE